MCFKEKNKIISQKRKSFSAVPAFSLIEIIIATALFSMVIISATAIFKMTIDSQRRAIASQNVQESLKYFLEVISKEIRMAQADSKDQCSLALSKNKVFSATSDSSGNSILKFKNYYDECVTYWVNEEDQRFYIKRVPTGSGGEGFPISPMKINIKKMFFGVTASSTAQEQVLVSIQAENADSERESSAMTLQTTLSSRYYYKIE